MKLKKPYYIVVFTAQLSENISGYEEVLSKIRSLSEEQEGFLGIDSVIDTTGKEITVSYWKDLESIKKWKEHPDHVQVQRLGRQWYESFSVKIAEVV